MRMRWGEGSETRNSKNTQQKHIRHVTLFLLLFIKCLHVWINISMWRKKMVGRWYTFSFSFMCPLRIEMLLLSHTHHDSHLCINKHAFTYTQLTILFQLISNEINAFHITVMWVYVYIWMWYCAMLLSCGRYVN